MAKLAVSYFVTLFFFLAIDYVWLAYVAKGFYADRLGLSEDEIAALREKRVM